MKVSSSPSLPPHAMRRDMPLLQANTATPPAEMLLDADRQTLRLSAAAEALLQQALLEVAQAKHAVALEAFLRSPAATAPSVVKVNQMYGTPLLTRPLGNSEQA